jgi:hypothetical protein
MHSANRKKPGKENEENDEGGEGAARVAASLEAATVVMAFAYSAIRDTIENTLPRGTTRKSAQHANRWIVVPTTK